MKSGRYLVILGCFVRADHVHEKTNACAAVSSLCVGPVETACKCFRAIATTHCDSYGERAGARVRIRFGDLVQARFFSFVMFVLLWSGLQISERVATAAMPHICTHYSRIYGYPSGTRVFSVSNCLATAHCRLVL